MVNYRRVKIDNGYYFFTVTLQDRTKNYLVKHIDVLRNAFAYARGKYNFEIDSIVILPDHLHAILHVPGREQNYPKIWSCIKSFFTRKIKKHERLIKNKRGEYNLWQNRYWEHVLRDTQDYHQHQLYIYFNPVKHGLVEDVLHWPYSSYHRASRNGTVEFDWSGQMNVDGHHFGEN